MDYFGYFGAEVAEHGAGLPNVRDQEELSPHYDLRVLRRRMLVNVRRDGPDDFRFARALREHEMERFGATPPTVRRIQLPASPEKPATPEVYERRVRRKQDKPKRIV